MGQEKSPNIVIVGGGIFGSAIACYLGQRRCENVVLLEGRSIAAGATGWSSGLVRVHYPNPWESQLAFHSLGVFKHWDERIGGSCGYRRTGFLRIVGVTDRQKLLGNIAMLRSMGVDTEFVEPEDLPRVQPYLSAEDVGGAAYEPEAGYASGTDAATALASAAADHGVVVRHGIVVLGLRLERERVIGVDTSDGFVSAGRVVIAAGAWSLRLLEGIGVRLPLRTKLIRAGLIQHPKDMMDPPNGYMVVIDDSIGTYFRPDRRDRTEFGLRYIWDVPPAYEAATVSMEVLADGVSHLLKRVPSFLHAGLMRAWGVPDLWSADGLAVLGPAPGIDRFYLAVGASGSGLKIGPAVGMGMAELLTVGRSVSVDLTPFRATRFQKEVRASREWDYQRPNWRNESLPTES